MDTIEAAKRGPSLSLFPYINPPLQLTSLTHQQQREGGKQEGERERVHTLIRALPSSPPVSAENKERGEREERKREDEDGKGGEKKEGCEEKEVEE